MHLISDLSEKQHGIEVLVRQLSLNPEMKLEKIKPEKLEKTTVGRIDIEYMTGKKGSPNRERLQGLNYVFRGNSPIEASSVEIATALDRGERQNGES